MYILKGYVKNEGLLRTIYQCQRGWSKGKFLENGWSFKEAYITMFLEVVITMTLSTWYYFIERMCKIKIWNYCTIINVYHERFVSDLSDLSILIPEE